MRNRFSNKLIAILISLFVAFSFCACSDKPAPDSQDSGSNNQADQQEEYIEEDEEAEIHKVDANLSQFYGSWTAKSEKAQYMYGNVDIIVNEDNTWSADITGEKLKGKWTDEGDHIHMNNELFSFDMALTENGNIIMIEDMDGDELITVLSRS